MRKTYTTLLGLICFFAGSTLLFSQGKRSPIPMGFQKIAHVGPDQRTCFSEEKMEESMNAHPELRAEYEKAQRDLQTYLNDPSSSKTSAVVTIPVVVHVVYRTSAGNLSDSRIMEQIDVLNADYRRTNADASSTPAAFSGVAADCEVEFCLATKDPTGASTTGITRTSTSTSNIGSGSGYYAAAPAWNRNKYLNIWVCEIGGGILGFAYKPGTAPATYDGVVIDYHYFGKTGASAPYNGGRTATHEVGHWLGLDHVWGPGSGGCGSDDGISDTPLQNSAYGGCPSYPQTSCSSSDMFMNYMDYVNDNCMNVFTAGQKAVFQGTLSGSRSSLTTSDGCSGSSGGGGGPTTCVDTLGFPLTGTPTLYGSGGTGGWGYLAGHNNYGDVAKVNRFSGSTHDKIDGVILNFGAAAAASGTSKVTVKIWNESGGEPGSVIGSEDLLINDIISAGGDVTVTFASPVTNPGTFYAGIEFAYAAGDTVGLITNTDGDVTTGSAWEKWDTGDWYNYNDGSSWGLELDHAIFPIVSNDGPTVSISPSSPTISPGGNVTLTATSSGTTCTWSPATGLNTTSGSTVIASPSVTTTYTVTCVDTSGCEGTESVTVTVGSVNVDDLFGNSEVKVYPNPTEGILNIEFEHFDGKDLDVVLVNTIGQTIFSESLNNFSGKFDRELDLSRFSAGIYQLSITDGTSRYTRKVVLK